MNFKTATQKDKIRWDHYILNHPRGGAYHLYAWKEAIEMAYGFKGIYIIAEQNNKIIGVLPLINIKKAFLFQAVVSLPYCDVGGPLADSVEIENELINHAMHLKNIIKAQKILFRAASPIGNINPELSLNHQKVRMILKLPDNSQTLLKSFKAKLRSQLKKPVRDGLTLHIGGINFVDDFYSVFSENMRDLGSPVHSKKWIKSILSAYKDRAVIFIVRMPDQVPVAGGILLLHPHMVSVPWASSLRRFNRWNPNMLLYWGFLKFASDFGYPKFDFGRSTTGEGTYRFKKQWGAKPCFLHWIDFLNSGVMINDSNSKNELRRTVEKCISKTPIPAANVIGALTRKYISL